MPTTMTTACNIAPAIGFYTLGWARIKDDTINFGLVQPGSYSDPVSFYVGNNICHNKGQFDNLPSSVNWKTVSALTAICVGFPTVDKLRLLVNRVMPDGTGAVSPFTATGSDPQSTDLVPYPSWLLQYYDTNTKKYMDLTDTTTVLANLKGDWYNKDVHNGTDPVGNYGKITLRIYVPADADQNVATTLRLFPVCDYQMSTIPAPFAGVPALQNGVCSPVEY